MGVARALVIGSINDVGLIGLVQKLENPEIHYLLLGAGGEATQLGKYGVTRAYVLSAQVDEASFSETLTDLVNANNYSVIAVPVSKFFKTAIAIAAQKLSAPLIVDVIDLRQSGNVLEVTYNGIGNRAQVTVKVTDKVFLMAPPARFKPVEKATTVSTETLQPKTVPGVKVVSTEEKPKGKVRIEDAELIVSVGRGFKKQEDLKLAFELAEVLGGAEIGCSRPIAADLKWLSEDHWVGLSGHKVRPKLYMAIGISGQPQHLAGMMESKTVVVINNDPQRTIL